VIRLTRFTRALPALLLVPLFQSACVMGMHTMHGGDAHGAAAPASRVVTEVRTGTYVAILDVPALQVGNEATLSLQVTNAETGQPETDLHVIFTISQKGASKDHHGPGGTYKAEAMAAGPPGTYVVAHTFEAHGNVAISATAVGGDRGSCAQCAYQNYQNY